MIFEAENCTQFCDTLSRVITKSAMPQVPKRLWSRKGLAASLGWVIGRKLRVLCVSSLSIVCFFSKAAPFIPSFRNSCVTVGVIYQGQHPEAILDLHRRSSTAKSPAKAIRKKRQFSKHDLVQPKDASGLSISSIPSISLEEQVEMAKDFSDVTQRGVPGAMTRETTLLRSEYEGDPPPEKKSKRYPCREDLRRSTTAIADDVITRDDPAVWNLPSGDEPLQPFVTLSPPQATAKITICDSLSPVDDRVRFGFRGWQSPLCDKGKNDEGQVEADDSRAGVLVAYGSAYDDEEVRPVSPTPREFDEDCWNGKEETGSGDLEHQVDAVVQSDFEGGRGKEVASTILQQSKDVYDDTRMSSTELDHNEGDQVFPTLGDDRAFSEDSDESDEAAAAASTAVATTYPSGENPLSASHSFFSVGGLFRPSFRYEDADFGGKNFGDSILGECRVVDGEEDWNPFYDVTITDGFPTVRRRYSTGAEPEVCMSDRTNDACETACAQYKSSNSSTQAGQGVFLDSDLRVMTRNKCGATWSPELLSKTSSPLPPCRPTIPWVSSRVGR